MTELILMYVLFFALSSAFGFALGGWWMRRHFIDVTEHYTTRRRAPGVSWERLALRLDSLESTMRGAVRDAVRQELSGVVAEQRMANRAQLPGSSRDASSANILADKTALPWRDGDAACNRSVARDSTSGADGDSIDAGASSEHPTLADLELRRQFLKSASDEPGSAYAQSMPRQLRQK